jgi:hypothetical protein
VRMQFDFDGNETPEQLRAIAEAINAYCGTMGAITFGIDVGANTVTVSAGVLEAGKPQPQTMNPDALLEAARFKEVPLTPELQKIKDAGGFRSEVNPSHSFTEGAEIPFDENGNNYAQPVSAAVVFGEQIKAIAAELHPIQDPVKVFEEKEAPLLRQAAELDAAGKPWDENIHASSRTKTADGCWKFKRGIDPALRQGVVGTFTADMTVQVEPQSSVVIIPPLPETPAIPPPPPALTEAHTLPWLMGQAAKHQKTKADIDAALAACGLKTIPDLLAQLDKMDAVAAALGVL